MSVRRAQDERLEGTPDGNSAITEISDVPDAPTIGAVTDPGTDGYASVAFTPAVTGGTATSYTVTSSPGNITGTGASSPVTVTGLNIGTSYTFTVTGTNSTGTGAASAASSTFTPQLHTSYESIATVVINSDTTSFSFSNIPQTYTNLQVRGFFRGSSLALDMFIQFNSDTSTSNYAYHSVAGFETPTVTTYYSNTQGRITNNNMMPTAANTFGSCVMDILDYTNTNKYKVLRYLGGREDNTNGGNEFTSGLWLSTAAITTITISTYANYYYKQYSHFALYGIKGS